MNSQWNTPPNGDFARYVEQLSARSAVARRDAEADGEHELDVGMTPSADPHGAVAPGRAAAHRRIAERLAAAGGNAKQGNARPPSFEWMRGIGAAWVVVLVALLIADAPFGIVLLVFAGGLWAAHQLRTRIRPQGINSWREWFEDLARKAAEKQQQQRQQGK